MAEQMRNNVLSGYENLANAIIMSAVMDLKTIIKSCKEYDDREHKVMNNHTTKFFYSEWFKILTNIDGDYIVKCLMKECFEE